MFLLIATLVLLFVLAFWGGYRHWIRFDQLNRHNLIITALIAMAILTLLTIAHRLGYFPQNIAAKFTMGLYSLAAGFFFGAGSRLVVQKKRAGYIEYMHRSFWIDIAPNLIASFLVAYGIYRTGILTLGPFTGIGITSGISLVGFGFFGWTVRLVPEFRSNGIVILDQFIPWKKVLAFKWDSEEVIKIDYFVTKNSITEFSTTIPAEDRMLIERILGKRIKEHEEQRKKILSENADN